MIKKKSVFLKIYTYNSNLSEAKPSTPWSGVDPPPYSSVNMD